MILGNILFPEGPVLARRRGVAPSGASANVGKRAGSPVSAAASSAWTLSRPRLHRLRLRTGVTISPPLRGFGRWAPDGGCVVCGRLTRGTSVGGRLGGLCWRGGAEALPPGLPRMWRSGGPIPGLRGSLVGVDAVAPPPPSAPAPNRGYHIPAPPGLRSVGS